MSKATVLEVIGEGQYAVRLEYDTTNLDAAVSALQQQLIDLTQPLLDAQVELIDLQVERDALADALDDAIEAYKDAVDADPGTADVTPVIAATKALAEAVTAVDVQRLKVQRLQSQKLSLAARKTLLENNSGAQQPESGTLVWCADYTTDISVSAEVGVSLIPGELSGATWTILPQQHPTGWGQVWTREAFGQLVPRLSMTPEATLYNWAMLPGWQRWMPTFRHGLLNYIDYDNDTCTVTLEAARSSAEVYPYTNGLPVNLAESTETVLENVPIRYMTCNADPFVAGDRVLVRFKNTVSDGLSANWDEPEVVGYVSNPQPCPTEPPEGDPYFWFEIGHQDGVTAKYWQFRWDDIGAQWVRSAAYSNKSAGAWVHWSSDETLITTHDQTSGGTAGRAYSGGSVVFASLGLVGAASLTDGRTVALVVQSDRLYAYLGGVKMDPSAGYAVADPVSDRYRGTFKPDGLTAVIDAPYSPQAYVVNINAAGGAFGISSTISKTLDYSEFSNSTESVTDAYNRSGTRDAGASGTIWQFYYYDQSGTLQSASVGGEQTISGGYAIAGNATDRTLTGTESFVWTFDVARSTTADIAFSRSYVCTYDDEVVSSVINRNTSVASTVDCIDVWTRGFNATLPGFAIQFDVTDGSAISRKYWIASDTYEWSFPVSPSLTNPLPATDITDTTIIDSSYTAWLTQEDDYVGLFPNMSPSGPALEGFEQTTGTPPVLSNSDASITVHARRISASGPEYELFGVVSGTPTDLISQVPDIDFSAGDTLFVSGVFYGVVEE